MQCKNHSDREALSLCHSCKEYYCRECLDEGVEDYFCFKDSCQQTKMNELEGIRSKQNIIDKNKNEVKENRKSSLKSYLAIVPGIIIGNLLGMATFLLLIGYFIGTFILKKWNKFNNIKLFENAFLIQSCHLTWFLSGLILLLFIKLPIPANIPVLVIEGVIYLILLLWFLIKVNFVSCLLLTLYQILSLYGNFITLNEIGIGSINAKSLVVHIFLRLSVIVLMVLGSLKTIKARRYSMNSINN